MTENEALPAPTPNEIESQPILAEYEAPWRNVEQSRVGERMRLALRAIATGLARDYREAAHIVGYKSHTDVYRYACLFGLSPTSKHLITDCKRVAMLGLGLVEERMLDDPESVSTRDAAVVSGIAIDKIAKRERWGAEHESGTSKTLEALDKVAESLKGRTLRLEVSVKEDEDDTQGAGGEMSAPLLEGDYEITR